MRRVDRLLTALILVTIFGALLRLIQLVNYPPSLNWDEASIGYNAFSILKSGRDEWGVWYPLIFRAFGDYKLPGYIYILVPFIKLIGFTPLSVRLPSALAGILLIPTSFYLAKYFANSKVALVVATLVSISPWSVFLSRIALEANLSLLFICLGLIFLVYSLNHTRNLFLSILFLGMSVWTYNSARVFVPLILSAFILLHHKYFLKQATFKRYFASILLAAVIFIPMILQLSSTPGSARFRSVSILNEGAIAYLEERRNTTELPAPIGKALYNKPVYFVNSFARNYLSHFLPNFLFVDGGNHFQFSIQGQGVLYLALYPFYLIGIVIVLFRSRNDSGYKYLGLWLLLAPIAASVTRESPHALRSLVMLPAILITISCGIIESLVSLKNNRHLQLIFASILFLFVTAEGFNSVHTYQSYTREYSWAWQYGYSEASELIKSQYDSYDYIIMTKKYGEPHIFLLSELQWDSTQYNRDNSLIRYGQSDWFWVDRFDKFVFVNDWEMPDSGKQFIIESRKESFDCTDKRCLVFTSPEMPISGWNQVRTIHFLNGSVAFEVYENR